MSEPEKKKEIAVTPAGVERARLKFKLHEKEIVGLRTDGDAVIVTYEDGTVTRIQNAVPKVRRKGGDKLVSTLFNHSGPGIQNARNIEEALKILVEAEKPSDIYSGPVFRIRPEEA